MTKKEFVDSVAEMNDMAKKDVSDVIDAVVETLTDVMSEGESITFQGFGTFSAVERSARTGRNPQTGKTLKIPAMMSPKFKASAALKAAVKG
jgi:DNA-binding protein HU-beta